MSHFGGVGEDTVGHDRSPQSVTWPPFSQPSTHLSVHLLTHPSSVCPFIPLVTHPFTLESPSILHRSTPLTRLLAGFLPCAPNSPRPCSRIYEILPQRIQQWQQSPCIAEEHGKKLLERIRREQQSARTRLQEMERRFHELEAIILRAKQQAVREDEEVRAAAAATRRGAACLALSGLMVPSTRAEQRGRQ